MDLADIYRTFHQIGAVYTFLSAHRMFAKIDHMTSQKTSLSTFKKMEIIPSIFSDHNGIKLEVSSRRKVRKFTNMWKINTTLLNNQWVKRLPVSLIFQKDYT